MTDAPVPEDKAQSEGKRAIAWLEKHWVGDKSCPICGQNSWTIGPVVELRGFQGGGLVIGGGTLVPVLPVTCSNCAYTFLFNALMSGVLEPADGRPEQ